MAIRFGVLGALLALATATSALAQPVRGGSSEREQQAQILASAGGAYDGPQSAYVARVGEAMARAAGLPNRCTFTVVNSEVINAFTAPPGCYVYVTRGLLSLMNSEAELAAVLGHELGHVTAKHATRQRNREALGGLAAVLVGAVAKSDTLGQLAGQVAQVGILSYSRTQEYEADTLALRYLPVAGYDVGGMSRVLDALQRDDQFSARAQGVDTRQVMPVWARTHPLTSDRITRAQRQAALLPPQPDALSNEAPYLVALDGLLYGEDAAQGVIRGTSFQHPGLRIAFDAPRGFTLTNGATAVRITGPSGLRAEFSTGRPANGRLEDYAGQVLRATVGQAPYRAEQPLRTTVNGIEAVVLPARAQASGGLVDVAVAAYAPAADRAYQFVAVAPAGQGRAFDSMISSFRRLSEREAAAVGSRRIDIVTLRPGDTAASLSSRMAVENLPLERFLLLNNLTAGEPLRAGRKVKLIVDAVR